MLNVGKHVRVVLEEKNLKNKTPALPHGNVIITPSVLHEGRGSGLGQVGALYIYIELFNH